MLKFDPNFQTTCWERPDMHIATDFSTVKSSSFLFKSKKIYVQCQIIYKTTKHSYTFLVIVLFCLDGHLCDMCVANIFETGWSLWENSKPRPGKDHSHWVAQSSVDHTCIPKREPGKTWPVGRVRVHLHLCESGEIYSTCLSVAYTQGRPWQVRGPMQDLDAGPLWAVILWRHRVQSTVLYDHGRA